MRKIIEHATGVILSDWGDVLMLHRRADGRASRWELPGGKIKIGRETEEQAIVREVGEELGVEATVERKLGQTVFSKGRSRMGMIKEYRSTWFLLDVNGEPSVREPRVFDDIGYIAIHDLVALHHAPPALSSGAENFRRALINEEVRL